MEICIVAGKYKGIISWECGVKVSYTIKKYICLLGVVIHAYNLCYSGGRNRRAVCTKTASKFYQRPVSEFKN